MRADKINCSLKYHHKVLERKAKARQPMDLESPPSVLGLGRKPLAPKLVACKWRVFKKVPRKFPASKVVAQKMQAHKKMSRKFPASKVLAKKWKVIKKKP